MVASEDVHVRANVDRAILEDAARIRMIDLTGFDRLSLQNRIFCPEFPRDGQKS